MAAPKGLAFIFSLTSGAPLQNVQMLSPGPSCQCLLPQTPPGLQAPTTWSPALNTEAQLGRKRKHSCEGNVVVVVVGGREATLGPAGGGGNPMAHVLLVKVCGEKSSITAHPHPTLPACALQLHAG